MDNNYSGFQIEYNDPLMYGGDPDKIDFGSVGGGGGTPEVEPRPGGYTAPPVTIEGKQEKIYPIKVSGDKPIEKATPSGMPYFNKVEHYQNVSTAGTESGKPFGGPFTTEGGRRGELYELTSDLPPVSEWDKPEYKDLIASEIAKTNALTNEPAVMRQAAMDQVTSGSTMSRPGTSAAEDLWTKANPSPMIQDVPPMPTGEYAQPKRGK